MKICNLSLLWSIPIISGLLFTVFSSSPLPNAHPGTKANKAVAANIVFKSTDGGRTWQDISKGLPENLPEDSIRRNRFFANGKGLFVRVGNELYHSTANATAPFWKKAIFPNEQSSIAPGKSDITANNYWAVNLKAADGTSIWSPIFGNASEPRIRSVFETAGGSIFIGTDRGLFKTANNGKNWKHVYAGGWAGNFAESNGVLLSTSIRRIIRSTDNGENWALVNEGGVTWDVKQARAGFAAISSGSASDTRRLRTSFDGGKTWQHAGLQDKFFIDSLWRTWDDRPRVQAFQTSVIQVDENFFSAHPGGIFRSSDKGKTWKLILPSIEGKVFSLLVSGNLIYAIPGKGGC